MTYKSLNRRGLKQSSSESSSASTSMGKLGPICWNCQEVGHRRDNCKNPSYCSKWKRSGHLPVKCPLKGKKTEESQTLQKGQQTSVDPMFSNIRNQCIHCRGDHAPGSCPTKTRPQATQNAAGYQTYDNGAVTGKANVLQYVYVGYWLEKRRSSYVLLLCVFILSAMLYILCEHAQC